MKDLLKEVEEWEYANGMEFQYIQVKEFVSD